MATQDAAVVSAQQLLKVASALSDGAAKLHAQLRHLEPAERDAVLDLVADQVTEIVTLWADLVRSVVSSDDAPTVDDTRRDDAAEALGPRSATPFAAQRQTRGAGDHPARVPAAEAVRSAPVQAEPEPARPQPEPASAPAPAPTVLRHMPTDAGRDSDRLTRDELTGVLNRQAGFAALSRDMDRCRRSGERFVLGYLNVDRMKVVNDTARIARRRRDPAQGHRRAARHLAVLRRDRPPRR